MDNEDRRTLLGCFYVTSVFVFFEADTTYWVIANWFFLS
jgi:hypothetical protein